MTGIIKRIDLTFWTNNIVHSVCFCKKCDPEAEGGKGGIICSKDGSNHDYTAFKATQRFCPTCGEEINWDDITEKFNSLR